MWKLEAIVRAHKTTPLVIVFILIAPFGLVALLNAAHFVA